MTDDDPKPVTTLMSDGRETAKIGAEGMRQNLRGFIEQNQEEQQDIEDDIEPDRVLHQIVNTTAFGVKPGGQVCRIALETVDEQVELQFEYRTLCRLINDLMILRNNCEKAADEAGKPVGRQVMPVNSFAVGSIVGVPGVVLTLNYKNPDEQIYCLADAGAANQLASALQREAAHASKLERSKPPTLMIPPKGIQK